MAYHQFSAGLGQICDTNFTSMLIEIGNSSFDEIQYVDIFSQLMETCFSEQGHVLNINPVSDYPQYMEANTVLRKYIPPVLLTLGTFGNMLSFVIMARNGLKVSTYCYLAVLAIMDVAVLYVGLFRMWIGNFSIDVQHTSNVVCKLVNFLGYVCSDMSVWLIVAVTIERFIAVRCPLRASRMCNIFRARFVIVGLLLIICGINGHIFWTVELQHSTINSDGKTLAVCEASKDYKVLVKEIWPWVDAAIYSFAPFTVISILNSLIVRQVLAARKRRSRLQLLQSKSNKRLLKHCTCPNPLPRKTSNEANKKLTFMLLAVSFTFLLTTLPMNVQLIFSAFYRSQTNDSKSYAKMALTRTVVELLMYINHSINFFLYCATGKKFRGQVRNLVCLSFGRGRNQSSFSVRTASYRMSRSPNTPLTCTDTEMKFFAS